MRWLPALMLSACLSSASGQERPAEPRLRDTISGALVRPDGAALRPFRWEREPDVIALYFGASWCAPCHAFQPVLREVRAALLEAGASTEVVFVGLDASASQTRRYMRQQRMPWPAIDPRRLRTLADIRALGGPAPPSLVLIGRDGRVLASAWEGRRYLGLQPVLERWRQAVAPAHQPPPPAGHVRDAGAIGEPIGL